MKNINTDQCYTSLFYIVFILSLLTPSITAAMQFVETIKDGEGMIEGLVFPTAVAVSPDGNHLYVVSQDTTFGDTDDSLTVFSRNPDTNNLIFIKAYKNKLAGVTGLEGAKSVTVSPDGQYVYVASDSLGAGKKGHIVIFSRENSTGKVNFIEKHELLDADSVVASSDNKHIYVASGEDNAVLVFSRAGDGKLTLVETKRNGEGGIEGLAGAKSLLINSEGKYIYVLGYDDDALAVFKRDSNTGQLTFVERHQNGENKVDGLAKPHSLIISPDNTYIYVRGQITTQFGDENAIAIFRHDPNTDKLTFIDKLSWSEIGLDDIDLISTTTDYFYIVNNKRLSVFSRDSNTGALALIDKGDEIEGVDFTKAITVSPDGKHLYIVEVEYGNDALLTFKRNTTTGIPTFAESIVNGVGVIEGLAKATSIAISPNDKHIYVAGKEDDAIAVFHRNTIDGTLTLVDKQKNPISGVDGLDGVNSVVVSLDGKHVYATSQNSNALVVFGRNEITGVLRFIEVKQEGVDGIDSLDGASSVVISPDDQYVYVTAMNDNAVTVFSRDINTGKLTFIEKQEDGKKGVTGLNAAHSLTISPDNKFLYVINPRHAKALAVFSRDINTGKLTFVETHEYTEENGIGGATSIIVSPDNKHVYLVSRQFDTKLGAITLFERELDTGKLTFVEKQVNGENNIEKLGSANSVKVSSDGYHVYVVSGIFSNIVDNALNVFSRDPKTGKLTFMAIKEEGVGGINGLKGAKSIAISSDNNHLYIASEQDNAITVFTTVINQPPQITLPTTQQRTSENSPLTFSNENQIIISDVDAFTHPIKVILTPSNGTLTLSHPACGQGNQPNEIICIGSLADINTALNGMTFTPDNGFAGEASFKINANDQGNTGGGEIGIDEDTIMITVNSTIGSPSVSDAETNVGTQTTHGLVISRGAGDGVEVTHFYMTNITDGALFLNDGNTPISNNSFISFPHGNAGLRFTPNSVNDGHFSVQSATCDNNETCINTGIATATIRVNTSPVFTSIEDITVSVINETVTLTAHATDKENNAFRFRLNDFEGADIDPNTGEFTWTPEKSGTYEFTIFATEIDAGISSSESFVITVTTLPEFVDLIGNQTITYGNSLKFKVNATHRENSPLIYELINSPQNASIDKVTGEFTWEPGYAGKESITIRVTETNNNQSVEETIDITIEKTNTGLQFTLDSAAIFKDGTVNVNGKITSYPNRGQDLENLDIQLAIIPPVGEFIIKTVKTHLKEEITGEEEWVFAFESLQEFNQVGRYEFQAFFAGNNNLAYPKYLPIEYLQVKALAGYAILIQGKLPDDEQGLEAHNKSLNRAYRSFKSRGFKDENIIYLNYDIDQSKLHIEVDDIPNRANIDSAFQSIQEKMTQIPGPLYVVMVDHGDIDGSFYLDDNKILPSDVNDWLNRLENGLSNDAKKYPRIVIVGACYSGNYIPILSKSGRVIITSTTEREVSYKGPKEPDQVRSGDYFIEALFAEFEQGHSLQDAFIIATEHVEILTQGGSNVPFNPYFQDRAAQHPLLDDNGDKMGSNIVPTIIEGQEPEQAEGFKAEQIYLGIGTHFQRDNPNAPAMIMTMTLTTSVEANDSNIELSATVNNPERVANNQVIADIRPPYVALLSDGIVHKGQLEINDSRVILESTADGRFVGNFDQITTPGKYDVFYFVQDTETKEISFPKHSVFYKNKAGNNPPYHFGLIEPADETETSTVVIFRWESSSDLNNDPITYTFILGTDLGLTREVYRQEGLLLPMAYINKETIINQYVDEHVGLRDGTTYYWKVIAIDNFGEKTSSSSTFSFTTNNKNQPPNIHSGISCSDYDVPLEEFEGFQPPIIESFPQPFFEDSFFQPQPLFGCHGDWQQFMGYSSNIGPQATQPMLRRKAPLKSTMPGKIQFLTDSTTVARNQGQIELLVECVGGDCGELSIPYIITEENSSKNESGILTWDDKNSSLQKINVDVSQYNEKVTVVLLGEKNLLGTPSRITVAINEQLVPPPNPVTTQPSPVPSAESSLTFDDEGNSNTSSITELEIPGSGDEDSVNPPATDTEDINNTENADPSTPTNQTENISQLVNKESDTPDSSKDINSPATEETENISVPDNNKNCSITTDKEVKAQLPSTIFSPSGTLQFSQLVYKANANQDFAQISITRKEGKFNKVSVRYIIDTSPPVRGTLSWKHDDVEPKLFEIPINDKLIAAGELIELRLFAPSENAKLGTRSEAVLQITNDDIVLPVECEIPPEPDDDEPDLPNLGIGTVLNGYNTDAIFFGGITVDEENYKKDDIVSTSDSVTISGKIIVASEQVGEKADILVVIGYKPLNTEVTETYQMLNTGRLRFSWDDVSKPETLIPFKRGITLQSTQAVEIYRGEFSPIIGSLRFFFGYRLENGDIIFNGKQAINVTVK